jgi:hypothetical protein
MLPLLGSEKPSVVRIIIGHTIIPYLAGQRRIKLRCRLPPCAADVVQYASTRDLQSHAQSGESTCGTPRSTEGQDLSMQCLRDK